MVTFNTSEDKYFATKAALLDPKAYHLASSPGLGFSATVPIGHTWYATNTFAVKYNTPRFKPQDTWPDSRRSGFLRPLDCRRNIDLPSGTIITGNQHGSADPYIYYCDPDDVWATDARYTTNPKGLYYDRIELLHSLPINELIIEATGGGSIDDVLVDTIPSTEDIFLTSASVYDASWLTIGWNEDVYHSLNVLSELNNSHSVRFAESIWQPMPRRSGFVVTLKKGSLSDYNNSSNPAIAYPIKSSGNLTYKLLPTGF
jgi:hypothetical protein